MEVTLPRGLACPYLARIPWLIPRTDSAPTPPSLSLLWSYGAGTRAFSTLKVVTTGSRSRRKSP
jgi:hypothetical protein